MDLFKALGTTPLSGFQTLVITLITFIHTAVRLTSSKHPYHSLAASMRNVWKCPLKLGLDCYFKQNNGFRSVRDIRPLISCEFQYLINVSGCITQACIVKLSTTKKFSDEKSLGSYLTIMVKGNIISNRPICWFVLTLISKEIFSQSPNLKMIDYA